TRPYVAPRTKSLLHHSKWEVPDHPVYSLDLVPSDYHLFVKLKGFFGRTMFRRK
ncbi:hypothetical protein WH47_12050, partial [Habropoda laboriosa]